MLSVELEMLGGPKDGLRINLGDAPPEVHFPVPAEHTLALAEELGPSTPLRMVYIHGAEMIDGHHVYRWDGYRR